MTKKEALAQSDSSTEEKIKEAARLIFHKKGFAATRTRDIAEEAGINLALLNYYFRSKEKLFDIIMLESLQMFLKSLASVINNEESNLEEKIVSITERYVNMMTELPELPLFILSELKRNPDSLLSKIDPKKFIGNSILIQQYHTEIEQGRIKNLPFIHFLMTMMSLIIFPFVASPMFKQFGDLSNEDYRSLLHQRKTMIPVWIQTILKA